MNYIISIIHPDALDAMTELCQQLGMPMSIATHGRGTATRSMMDLLGIAGNRTASVALIQNARSKKTASGRKDIIKVEGDASWLNLDVLAYLDPNISVTIIENGKAVRKEQPKPPKRLVNIVRCKNPRCISSIEEECDQIFELSSNGKYRCIYCEQELQVKPE